MDIERPDAWRQEPPTTGASVSHLVESAGPEMEVARRPHEAPWE